MTNEQKAIIYNQLMSQYTKIQNSISSIKGESISLNENQIKNIKNLEQQLRNIMERAYRL